MQIFDEIKARGVQKVGFICMDGLSGLEDGAKAIFPNVVVQRCIVHLIRNSLNNWALVRNQLLLDERMATLFDTFDF